METEREIALPQMEIPVLILPMRNGNDNSGFFSSHIFPVLILPMRNGNCMCLPLKAALPIVLILPMRNGNKYSTIYQVQPSFFVLILPMRNGNNPKSRKSQS